jgi:hypothetical protein
MLLRDAAHTPSAPKLVTITRAMRPAPVEASTVRWFRRLRHVESFSHGIECGAGVCAQSADVAGRDPRRRSACCTSVPVSFQIGYDPVDLVAHLEGVH